MPIEISPGQIIWVDCADEEEVPKSDENNLVLDFPGPSTPETVQGNKKSLKCSPQLTKENLKKKAENSQNSVKPSIAEIQRNLRVQSGLVQLENLRKKAKNKVEKAENTQNSAKPSNLEVESEVQKNRMQLFENQGFVQTKAEMADMAEMAEIKTLTEDPFGKWEKLEDTDIFDIPTGPIKLLSSANSNSFGPKCSKKRDVKRFIG